MTDLSRLVRPLIWEDFEGFGARASAYYQANYLIQKWRGRDEFEVSMSYPGHQTGYDGPRWHSTLEAAKAAAQADYTARILAALEPDPAAIREAALREAADVCTYVIKNIEILKADGETYETPRVHKVARGLVDVARQDILALAKGAAE